MKGRLHIRREIEEKGKIWAGAGKEVDIFRGTGYNMKALKMLLWLSR